MQPLARRGMAAAALPLFLHCELADLCVADLCVEGAEGAVGETAEDAAETASCASAKSCASEPMVSRLEAAAAEPTRAPILGISRRVVEADLLLERALARLKRSGR